MSKSLDNYDGFDFTKDDDDDFSEIDDDLIMTVASIVQFYESQPHVNDKEREELVKRTYELVKSTACGKKVKVKCILHEPFPSSGNVQVSGMRVTFRDSKKFAMAMEMADGFEIETKTNGPVSMNFYFNHLTKHI